MKLILSLLTIAILNTAVLKAQSAEDSVKLVINNMFSGMKDADADLIRTTFADSAILQTVTKDKAGNIVVKNENLSGFLEFVGKQVKGAADERIQFETIKIDGPLAVVWTPYQFYYKGKFSHCGVNSFHLVRISGKWQIQYLIDTRRREGCE